MGFAILVVDMVKDFVTGKLGSSGAQEIVGTIRTLLITARENKIPVIYLLDAHRVGDTELKVWGEHAMDGTEGSEIVSELSPEPEDIILRKQVYSGFFGTDLEETLRLLDVESIVFTGVSTDICVQNNVADAFYHGFKIYVVNNGTASIDSEHHGSALDYMARIYSAKIIDSEECSRLITNRG